MSNINVSVTIIDVFAYDESSIDSLSSAGNALFPLSYDTFQTELDQSHYNYHGARDFLPNNEFLVTICAADTINMKTVISASQF